MDDYSGRGLGELVTSELNSPSMQIEWAMVHYSTDANWTTIISRPRADPALKPWVPLSGFRSVHFSLWIWVPLQPEQDSTQAEEGSELHSHVTSWYSSDVLLQNFQLLHVEDTILLARSRYSCMETGRFCVGATVAITYRIVFHKSDLVCLSHLNQ